MKVEIISVILFFFLYFIFSNLNYPFEDVLITSIVLSSLPTLLYYSYISKKEEIKENSFFRFSIDLVELLRSGIPLPIALNYLEKADYGPLNRAIKNLSARIDWGVGIVESFALFSEECNNKTISKIIKSVINIYKSGGELDKGLEAAVKSIKEVRQLKKQRESLLFENVIHSYIVFFFFLITSLIMIIFLVPFLDISNLENGSRIRTEDISSNLYIISIVQSFFSGLAIGKMYKGSYKAGLKHSIIFLFLTLIIFKLVIPMFPKSLNIYTLFNF
ncbi:MAG: type II secretion system F family protein [Nanopusillaceae archaeon]